MGDIMSEAKHVIEKMQKDVIGEPKVLGLHVRIFKHDLRTSGGFIPKEVSWSFEQACNMEPDLFVSFVGTFLIRTFDRFWPTHTFVASNERDSVALHEFLRGFPGPRV